MTRQLETSLCKSNANDSNENNSVNSAVIWQHGFLDVATAMLHRVCLLDPSETATSWQATSTLTADRWSCQEKAAVAAGTAATPWTGYVPGCCQTR